MVIVLEGGSGVGKSTVGALLEEYTGWPLYRSFRGSPDDHNPGARLKHLGLPVNTWCEDAFLSDVLASLRADLVVDRGMPSALAYTAPPLSSEHHGLSDEEKRREALELWDERMAKARAVVVLLKAPLDVRSARCPRKSQAHLAAEAGAIHATIDKLRHTPVMHFGTGYIPALKVARLIALHLGLPFHDCNHWRMELDVKQGSIRCWDCTLRENTRPSAGVVPLPSVYEEA